MLHIRVNTTNFSFFQVFCQLSVTQRLEDISCLGCAVAVAVTVDMEVGRRLCKFIHVTLD
jgi:hypothetical protein